MHREGFSLHDTRRVRMLARRKGLQFAIICWEAGRETHTQGRRHRQLAPCRNVRRKSHAERARSLGRRIRLTKLTAERSRTTDKCWHVHQLETRDEACIGKPTFSLKRPTRSGLLSVRMK